MLGQVSNLSAIPGPGPEFSEQPAVAKTSIVGGEAIRDALRHPRVNSLLGAWCARRWERELPGVIERRGEAARYEAAVR